MKAIYLDKVQTLVQREVEMPTYRDDQVLIKIKAVGVCGSDVHYWHKGNIGSFVVKEPMILGHECSGEVVEVGASVLHLKKGDMVVIEPGFPCYKCEHCMKGMYNLCPEMAFYATPPYDGCLVEYVSFDANLVFKIPDEITDYALATFVEPLAVGVYAASRSKPTLGENVIVFGGGVIGIACMLAAKAMGSAKVTVADVREDRLALAKLLGADEIIDLRTASPEAQAFDVGFEATGADPCYAHLAKCMKSGGRISAVGMGADIQSIPMVEFVCREIDIIPSFRYKNVYNASLELLKKNIDDIQKLITHRYDFSLENVEEAIKTSFSDTTACKVVVEF